MDRKKEHYSGNCELTERVFIFEEKKRKRHMEGNKNYYSPIGRNDLVAVTALSQGMRVVSELTDISTVRWFKARPSRPFGAAISLVRQRTMWNADNWSFNEAREVIPQPQLQPVTSKEIRRCLQIAQLSRATRKPFCNK